MKKKLTVPQEVDLGEKDRILPGQEPKIVLSIKRIPVRENTRGFIPVCEPKLDGNELRYITHCVESGWISSAGKYVEEFEEKFAHCCGARFGVACTSGTTALHLALAVMGVGEGDEVIIPTFTMIATPNAVTYTRATPILVDAERRTWNIDVERIEEKITPRTRVIIPVHTYGLPCEMDRILEIARHHSLYVIEDAAEAHGAAYKGRKVGSMGDVACFSFYANKIITTGEGGMIATNKEELYQKARKLRDHAFSEERHFWHKFLGYNYRMTNLQAAIGLAQVERFKELVEARIRNARLYNSFLRGVQGITLPPETQGTKNVFWMYSILIEKEFGISRDELRRKLAQQGIETRSFFIPIHLQPLYYDRYKEEFPVAEELCQKGMYLPSSANLTEEEIEFITEVIQMSRRR